MTEFGRVGVERDHKRFTRSQRLQQTYHISIYKGIDQYERDQARFPNISAEGLRTLWKARTGLVKMAGPKYSIYWRYLVYWETFWGYQLYKDLKSFDSEIRRWLCTPHLTGGIIGRGLYEQLIRQETRKWLHANWKAKGAEWMPIRTWVQRGTWAEGKAGDEGKARYTLDDKVRRTGRTKGAMSRIYRDVEVEQDLLTPRHEEMYVLQKSESTKVRAVAKTSSHVNRKMNYLSHVLEAGLHGSLSSTLFATGPGNEDIDMDLLSAVGDNSIWKVPLDQSSFDQIQSFNIIRATIAEILSFICDQAGKSKAGNDIKAVCVSLWASLFTMGCRKN